MTIVKYIIMAVVNGIRECYVAIKYIPQNVRNEIDKQKRRERDWERLHNFQLGERVTVLVDGYSFGEGIVLNYRKNISLHGPSYTQYKIKLDNDEIKWCNKYQLRKHNTRGV